MMKRRELQNNITKEISEAYPEMRGATVRMVPLDSPPQGAVPVLGPTGARARWYQWVGEVDLEGPDGTKFRRRIVVFCDELGSQKIVARSR